MPNISSKKDWVASSMSVKSKTTFSSLSNKGLIFSLIKEPLYLLPNSLEP